MITRIAKLLLLAGIAFFYSLVVFNNLTDFNSNYEFVRHVLLMDTIFPGNHGMWRAVTSSAADYWLYIAIIVWEIVTAILLWAGCVALLRAIGCPAKNFEVAKRIPVMALTLSLLMWLVAFISVGGEWFLMWQSRAWNGVRASSVPGAPMSVKWLSISAHRNSLTSNTTHWKTLAKSIWFSMSWAAT